MKQSGKLNYQQVGSYQKIIAANESFSSADAAFYELDLEKDKSKGDKKWNGQTGCHQISTRRGYQIDKPHRYRSLLQFKNCTIS